MRTSLLLATFAIGTAFAQTPAANPNKQLIDRYCVGCHNARTRTAKLALDELDLAHPEKDPLTWERAIRKLRAGMMPPPGAPRPPVADSARLAAYLETSLDKAGTANLNPGNVRLHRLNRSEYANAARDLFGIEVDPAQLLPTDDISDGFDNIARALKVSPSFLDQYILAGRAVAKQAVGAPVAPKEVRTALRGTDANIPLPPGARAGVTAKFLAPYDGDYELRVAVNPTVFTVDGVPVDSAGRTHLKAGEHTLVAGIAGRSFAESEGILQGFIPNAAGTGYASTGVAVTVPGAPAIPGGGRGGAGGLSITVNGPFNATGTVVETSSRAKVFVCRPPDVREETACASRIFANLAQRAYRRPVTEQDLAPMMRFFTEGRKLGSFDAGIENGLVAMLASSKFLYRVEAPPATAQPGDRFKLGGMEIASRLSFFLWSSLPDEPLLNLAQQGKLSDPKVLEQQVRRMLADPRSKTLTTNFAFEWLKVRDMASLEPDPYTYPSFNAPLRQALQKEIEMFIGSIFAEDRSVVDLLSANHTFVNERLAMHYGIENVRGDHFRRVTLADRNRFGLLGKGAILMVTAYPNRTSPVLRGSYILEKLLGTPPAPPPPNVEAFKENQEGEKPKTIRQILETHRAAATCNACHGVMDPLGFSLENFDTIGAFRTQDRATRSKLDTSGTLVDGTPLNGPADLRTALLARSDQFAQTFTEKMMMYALGREVEYFDMPTIRKIVRTTKPVNFKFSSIVMGIVNSPAFLTSSVELPKKP